MNNIATNPSHYEVSKDVLGLNLLGSVGVGAVHTASLAVFEGSFSEIEKAKDELFCTVIVHLGGAKVHWGERDNSKIDNARAGTVTIDPAQMDRRGESTGNLRFAHCYLGETFLLELSREIAPGTEFDLGLADVIGHYDETLSQMIKLVSNRLLIGNMIEDLELNAIGQLIGLHLLKNYCRISGRALRLKPQGLTPNKLNDVIDYIDSALDTRLSLDTLSGLASLTPYHFARSFKDAVGQTPHAYVIDRRIDAAKLQLESASSDLAEIAFNTGFSSQQHFTTVFHQRTGMTPGKYRELVHR